MIKERTNSKLTAILSADVKGYRRLMGKMKQKLYKLKGLTEGKWSRLSSC